MIAIVVGLVTAIITAVVTAPVADHVTKAMKVSNMEGNRGYMVILLILCGAVGGLIIGLVVTGMVGAAEWSQYWKAQGYALLASHGLLFAIAGMCLLSVPRQLLLKGELIALDFEVRLPAELGPAWPMEAKDVRMSLYATRDDNRYVDLDTTRIQRSGGELFIPGEVMLNTASPDRMLSLIINDSTSYTLDMPLGVVPTEQDLAWTKPLPMRLSTITGTAYTYTPVMVRYRVVKKGKPSA